MPRRASPVPQLPAVLVAALVTAMVAAPGFTQDFDMDWFTIDHGGGRSAGSGYSLRFTLGQADTALPITGGGYSLAGGFWSGTPTPPEPPLFADGFEAGDASLWDSVVGAISGPGPLPASSPQPGLQGEAAQSPVPNPTVTERSAS